jgi:hypothetical protein
VQTDRKKLELSKEDEEETRNDIVRRTKVNPKNKSKSKSKNIKSITLLGLG